MTLTGTSTEVSTACLYSTVRLQIQRLLIFTIIRIGPQHDETNTDPAVRSVVGIPIVGDDLLCPCRRGIDEGERHIFLHRQYPPVQRVVDVMPRIVINDGRLESVDGRVISGSCNRCGLCCSVYESGFPCRHLLIETVDGKPSPSCNHKTLHAGYWGRPFGCAVYPSPDNVLPTCGYRYD